MLHVQYKCQKKKKYPPQSQFLQSSAVPISNSEKNTTPQGAAKTTLEVVKNVIP
jgi:hypothetical protein